MELFLIIVSVFAAIIAIVGSIVPALPGPVLAYFALWLARWSGYVELSNSYMWILGSICNPCWWIRFQAKSFASLNMKNGMSLTPRN